ncbi:hypothetical protein [Allokutzneria sp. A3M-2-11 16]|uniref:hypothetical protein n=1 Tax=Allokutzneria sp. A3M-2-11 16 TaxID=2962043 RepID=UPI0027E2BA0B|nr:hypothetical protein [Allokutzneria sp. A3M-2-11 16]
MLRASTEGGTALTVEANRLPLGGGNTSVVGSARFTSSGGVGRIAPKPSARLGNGWAPTRHFGFGASVVVVVGAVVAEEELLVGALSGAGCWAGC